jgi:hypothetical protein
MFPALNIRPGMLVHVVDEEGYRQWYNKPARIYSSHDRLFVFGLMRQKNGDICADCSHSLKEYVSHSFIPVEFLECIE